MNMLALCAAEKSVFIAEIRSSKVLFIKAQSFFYLEVLNLLICMNIQIADDLSLTDIWTLVRTE
jgi:hypothetical protein